MNKLPDLVKDLEERANKKQAQNLQRFFKTNKGEYGEGDIFLGIKVPVQRTIAKKYADLSLSDLQKLLNSRIHEHRLVGLLILTAQYKNNKKIIYKFYLRNTKNINNWDLVDLSAPNIVGQYLLDKNRSILYKLARSKNLWEKRIAMLSTFTFIRYQQFFDSLKIAEILLKDKHDLIHKAVGWMLREIGKRDLKTEEKFLNKHYRQMPRTMLRYAIEKLPKERREFYLKK